MRLKAGTIDTGDAEKLVPITADWTIWLPCDRRYRWYAAVCHAVVIYVFIRQAQLPIRAKRHGQIRVPSVTLTAYKIAVALKAFVNCVHPNGGIVA